MIIGDDDAAVSAAPADARARVARLRDRARAVRQACRQIFGIPDYERYLAHMAARHPDLPVLSRREFFAKSSIESGKSGPRCC